MAKSKTNNKKDSKKESSEAAVGTLKLISILGGEINDDFCNFSYKIVAGIGVGFTHKVQGKDVGLVRQDMKDAFQALNVHMAVIDEAFKLSSLEIENIDDFHSHELAAKYHVDAFKLKGDDSELRVILIGTKNIGVFGYISIETPAIDLTELSSYPFYNELSAAIETARFEVSEYNGGKYDPIHKKEVADEAQLTIGDQVKDDAAKKEQSSSEVEDVEFESDESDATAKKV